MHQDVVDLNAFYLTRLGRVARRIVGQQIRRAWPSVCEEVVLGLGYAVPFLGLFREEADRVFAIMPAGQGVMAWPESGGRQVALADDGVLPLPDGSVDRILIVHGLEFSEQRRPMLEEVWRVMRPNGRLLVLVPNRHGLWARAEATPFGHGSPFSASQLARLLREHRFAPVGAGAMLSSRPRAAARCCAPPPSGSGWGGISGAPSAASSMSRPTRPCSRRARSRLGAGGGRSCRCLSRCRRARAPRAAEGSGLALGPASGEQEHRLLAEEVGEAAGAGETAHGPVNRPGCGARCRSRVRGSA